MLSPRTLTLSSAPEAGNVVVYMMSRDQRVKDNHALLAAQEKAVALSLPLVVLFQLRNQPGHRAYEHAVFMLKGLEEVASSLKELGIPFIMTTETGESSTSNTLKTLKPAALYFDFSPLKGPRTFAKTLSHELGVASYVIDTHNIIPAWKASDKQEFAAHTFRHKVHRLLESYLVEPPKQEAQPYPSEMPTGITFDDAYALIEAVYPKRNLKLAAAPGEQAAHAHLARFIDTTLEGYAHGRNDIAIDSQSQLSPYLHFGQLSSLRVALEVLYAADAQPLLFQQAKMASAGDTPSVVDGMNALFEEMIVRKELSDNFCLYGSGYTRITDAAPWAQQTLNEHRDDARQATYSLEALENATTHDGIWNAAQRELTHYGKMHGYMRMYWAKKILEWTNSPEEALEYAIVLNDRYSIDGGDPNGYVGMLWSIAGLHDRPWTERPIFGKIRYMNDLGLKRKFDVEAYIKRVSDA